MRELVWLGVTLFVLSVTLLLQGVTVQAKILPNQYECYSDPFFNFCIESRTFDNLIVNNLNVLDTLNVANISILNQTIINSTIGLFDRIEVFDDGILSTSSKGDALVLVDNSGSSSVPVFRIEGQGQNRTMFYPNGDARITRNLSVNGEFAVTGASATINALLTTTTSMAFLDYPSCDYFYTDSGGVFNCGSDPWVNETGDTMNGTLAIALAADRIGLNIQAFGNTPQENPLHINNTFGNMLMNLTSSGQLQTRDDIIIGDNVNNVDYNLIWAGNKAEGRIQWQEDEKTFFISELGFTDGTTIMFDDLGNHDNYGLVVENSGGEGGNLYINSSTATSFTGETLISIPGGFKAIGRLRPGDTVVTFWWDRRGRGFRETTVNTTVERNVTAYYRINNVINATRQHPFYTPQGWVTVGDLQIGDQLLRLSTRDPPYAAEWINVTDISYVLDNVTVYSLIVNPPHTYFAMGYLVHNKAAGGGGNLFLHSGAGNGANNGGDIVIGTGRGGDPGVFGGTVGGSVYINANVGQGILGATGDVFINNKNIGQVGINTTSPFADSAITIDGNLSLGMGTIQQGITMTDETGAERCVRVWSDGVVNGTAGRCT